MNDTMGFSFWSQMTFAHFPAAVWQFSTSFFFTKNCKFKIESMLPTIHQIESFMIDWINLFRFNSTANDFLNSDCYLSVVMRLLTHSQSDQYCIFLDAISSSTLPLSDWYHFAVCRDYIVNPYQTYQQRFGFVQSSAYTICCNKWYVGLFKSLPTQIFNLNYFYSVF